MKKEYVSRVYSLTKEQKDAMASYAKKWIEIGLRTGETDWDTFDKYMPICYEKAGLKYPKRVVRVSSPIVGAFASAIAEAIYKKYVRDAVDGAVSVAVDVAVSVAVDVAVDVAVRDAVGVAVRVAVRDAVGVAVDVAVRDAVGVAVRDAVGVAVDDAVDVAVDVAVRDAVDDAVKITEKLGLSLVWHYWLGGQFWVGYGWDWGVAFVNFFFDICKLKLAEDIMERAFAYRKVCESVNYIWPNRDFVMVCARPEAIHRNKEGRLHNEHGMSIRYPDGWGLYHLNGVRFPEELYKKVISRNMAMKDILAIVDIDQRVQAMKFAKYGLRDFYKSENGKMIDHYVKMDKEGRPINYELWRIPKGKTFTKEVSFAIYDCPSARERGEHREYSKGVPNFNTIAEAMAWGMSSETDALGPEEWKELVPLIHES